MSIRRGHNQCLGQVTLRLRDDVGGDPKDQSTAQRGQWPVQRRKAMKAKVVQSTGATVTRAL